MTEQKQYKYNRCGLSIKQCGTRARALHDNHIHENEINSMHGTHAASTIFLFLGRAWMYKLLAFALSKQNARKIQINFNSGNVCFDARITFLLVTYAWCAKAPSARPTNTPVWYETQDTIVWLRCHACEYKRIPDNFAIEARRTQWRWYRCDDYVAVGTRIMNSWMWILIRIMFKRKHVSSVRGDDTAMMQSAAHVWCQNSSQRYFFFFFLRTFNKSAEISRIHDLLSERAQAWHFWVTLCPNTVNKCQLKDDMWWMMRNSNQCTRWIRKRLFVLKCINSPYHVRDFEQRNNTKYICI